MAGSLESFGIGRKTELRKAGALEKIGTIAPVTEHAQFAGGRMGTVKEVDISLRRGDRERTRRLVEKTYGGGTDMAKRAVKTYEVLRAAKLKVPPTFRFEKGRGTVVMTNYNSDERVALGGNRNERARAGRKFDDIPNFEKVLREMREQCERAARAHIRFGPDLFFLIFPAGGTVVDMDFVIGDMDLVTYNSELTESRLLQENLKWARDSVNGNVSFEPGTSLAKRYEEALRSLW